MKINTAAIEEKYSDIGLKILSISEIKIEKLNYNKVVYEYFFEIEEEYYKDDIDEVFEVKSFKNSRYYIEDEVNVRVDKNLAQGVFNHLNNHKKEHGL